jgi:hypothetical protein
MGRIANGWHLTKQCAGVINKDKELVVFPIVAGIAELLIIAAFAIPFWAAGSFSSQRGDSISPGEVVGIVAFYFVTSFVIAFCGAALVGAALVRMRGGDPTLSDGWRAAGSHLGAILGWAALSATVGLVLQLIADRLGAAGRIVGGLLGAAWGVITFLAIPSIIAEDAGPVTAVKRSTSLLKQTWGEQLTGRFAMGAIFGIIGVLVVLVGVGVCIALAMASGILAVAGVAVFAFLLVVVVLVSQTFNGVFQAAVYQFTTTGDPGPDFDAATIQSSLQPRRSSARAASSSGLLD